MSAAVPVVLHDAGERKPALIGARDALAFLLPSILVLEFSAIGRLYVSETILLAMLPFLLHRAAQLARRPVPKLPVILGVIWLVAQVESDIYRGAGFVDYSRGWSKIAFTLTNFVALYLLLDHRGRRMRLFAWGMVAGLLAQYYISPSTYALGNPWKFGFAVPVSLAVVLIASLPSVWRRPAISAALVGAMAVVNLLEGFRSLAGICFLTGAIVLYSAARRRTHVGRRSARATIAACVVATVAAFAFATVYERSARSGALGLTAQRTYEAQAGGFGVLVGGRPELLASLRAIGDSPVIGHGSWAKDPKYALLMRTEMARLGYHPSGQALSPDAIPEHSHVLGAWVEAGFFGTFFWFWAFALAAATVSRLHVLRDRLAPFVAFIGLSLMWDIAFSPFGAERRLLTPFYLVVLLFARDRLKGRADAATVGGAQA